MKGVHAVPTISVCATWPTARAPFFQSMLVSVVLITHSMNSDEEWLQGSIGCDLEFDDLEKVSLCDLQPTQAQAVSEFTARLKTFREALDAAPEYRRLFLEERKLRWGLERKVKQLQLSSVRMEKQVG